MSTGIIYGGQSHQRQILSYNIAQPQQRLQKLPGEYGQESENVFMWSYVIDAPMATNHSDWLIPQ